MKLNSKLTWGLAWIGLAIVVAVPSADFLTGKMGAGGTTAMLTSTTDPVTPAKPKPAAPALTPAPVKTAAVTTKVTKNGVTIIPAGADPASADPVDKLLKAGKPLPDYITDDSTDTAKASVPATAPSTEPTQVASLPLVPPTPFPSTARPHATPRPVVPTAPVIVDDGADQEAAIDTPDITPVPPAGLQDDNAQSWKQARLNRYLERHGLIDESGRSSASVTVDRPSRNYDPNGFYLSDGPNNSRAARRARVEQLFGDDEPQDTSDNSWFSLF